MTERLRLVLLTDEELVLLNGECRPDIQHEVDNAVNRLLYVTNGPPNLTRRQKLFVGETVAVIAADASGHKNSVNAPKCNACPMGGEHATYRSGANKGRPNRNRPILIQGTSYHWRGYGFVCLACATAIHPYLVDSLINVPAELPDTLLATPDQMRWRRVYVNVCRTCNHTTERFSSSECPTCCSPMSLRATAQSDVELALRRLP